MTALRDCKLLFMGLRVEFQIEMKGMTKCGNQDGYFFCMSILHI